VPTICQPFIQFAQMPTERNSKNAKLKSKKQERISYISTAISDEDLLRMRKKKSVVQRADPPPPEEPVAQRVQDPEEDYELHELAIPLSNGSKRKRAVRSTAVEEEDGEDETGPLVTRRRLIPGEIPPFSEAEVLKIARKLSEVKAKLGLCDSSTPQLDWHHDRRILQKPMKSIIKV
jgi:hypothetical protein